MNPFLKTKMGPKFALILFLCLCISLLFDPPISEAHPTHYDADTKDCGTLNPPKFQSYHIHVMFWQNNEKHVQEAMKLRQRFLEKFNLQHEKNCTGLFHQGRLCMFEVDFDPVGPFVAAQWAVYLEPEDFHTTVPWIMQHRLGFDVLVHPNSGCATHDHMEWAVWGGNPWEIDVTPFGDDLDIGENRLIHQQAKTSDLNTTTPFNAEEDEQHSNSLNQTTKANSEYHSDHGVGLEPQQQQLSETEVNASKTQEHQEHMVGDRGIPGESQLENTTTTGDEAEKPEVYGPATGRLSNTGETEASSSTSEEDKDEQLQAETRQNYDRSSLEGSKIGDDREKETLFSVGSSAKHTGFSTFVFIASVFSCVAFVALVLRRAQTNLHQREQRVRGYHGL